MLTLVAQSGYDAIVPLLTTLVQIPVFGVATLSLIKMLMDRAIHPLVALGAFAVLLLCMAISISSKNVIVTASVSIALVALLAFFPFAEEQVERVQLKGIDIEQLDKAYQAVAENPKNIPARFKLAQGVYAHGLLNHAIAIGVETLRQLDTVRDPLKNMSMLDAYRTEQGMVKSWQIEAQKVGAVVVVKCPRCNSDNPPGSIACVKCQGPYLLDVARNADMRPKILSRLVLGWVLVALLIAVVAFVSTRLSGIFVMIVIGLAVFGVGFVLHRLFQPQKVA